jgi:pimeloyl-ACP methyl ester carboxylesterase
MGGLTSAALLERYPEDFDGALPLCASVAGGVGMLNQSLDAAFTFKTLLAPEDDRIELVDVDDEQVSRAAAQQVLDTAQTTPEGRARIALAAAFAQLPGWTQPGTDRPGAHDWAAQQEQQHGVFMFSVFSPRQPLEARAGGNFSWNTGVDYRRQLAASGNAQQVRALYRAAGLDLDADLGRLEAAPRIAADPDAVQYMLDNAAPTGQIEGPVLTLHETGDTAPTVTQARAYADAVAAAGNRKLLRQTFVDRPGHCDYTPAEQLAALTALEERIDSWARRAVPARPRDRRLRRPAPAPVRPALLPPERAMTTSIDERAMTTSIERSDGRSPWH